MTPLTPREIFDAYVRDRRSQAIHGFRCDVLDHVVRYTPLRPELEGFIVFANLDESNVDAAIKAQVEHFENIDAGFEWKVYEFDPPASLPQRLTAHAFNPGDLEAFMVYPTSEHRSRPLRAGVTIERVESRDGIRTVVKL